MDKKDAIIIALVAFLISSNATWYINALPKHSPLPDNCFMNGNVYDCRRLSTFQAVEVYVLNAPVNEPLGNVTVQLYTFQLELLSEWVTNSTGTVLVKFPYNDTFYIELTYWICFAQGGIEKWHKWALFTANTNGDYFTLNMSLGPADWPTSPSLETP